MCVCALSLTITHTVADLYGLRIKDINHISTFYFYLVHILNKNYIPVFKTTDVF